MIGAIAYLAGLVATAPARLIVEPGAATNIASVGGTLWRGRAVLAGGEVAAWRWAPLRSLTGLGYAANVTVDGAGTTLTGQARLRPGSALLTAVSGQVTGALVSTLWPRLPFRCATTIQVNIKQLALGAGTADGRLLTDAGTCAASNSPALAAATPALLFEMHPSGPASSGRIAPQAHPRVTFATITRAADGTLALAFTPAGAAALPFAPR